MGPYVMVIWEYIRSANSFSSHRLVTDFLLNFLGLLRHEGLSCGRRPSPSAFSIYTERRKEKRFWKGRNAQQRRGDYLKSLFSFHWRLCPLALLSCHLLRAPMNLRPTSELFFCGCHKLATVRLHGYHHPNLFCSCPLLLQPLTHFFHHGLSHATFSQPGLCTHRATWARCPRPGDFHRLTRKIKSPQDLITHKIQTPSKQKWIYLELKVYEPS